MKKGLMIFTFMVFAAVFFSSSVNADTVSITFGGGGPSVDITNRYYIDPYSATVNGTPTTVWCVDYNHEVASGQTWTANVTSLDPTNINFGATYLGDKMKYQEMAYLVQQFQQLSGPAPVVLVNQQAIQAVIWNLSETPTNTPYLTADQIHTIGGSFETAYNSWSAKANTPANYSSADYSGWEILSDTRFPSGSPIKQEFLVHVPEPFTLLFLGGCLLGAGLAGRRLDLTQP